MPQPACQKKLLSATANKHTTKPTQICCVCRQGWIRMLALLSCYLISVPELQTAYASTLQLHCRPYTQAFRLSDRCCTGEKVYTSKKDILSGSSGVGELPRGEGGGDGGGGGGEDSKRCSCTIVS